MVGCASHDAQPAAASPTSAASSSEAPTPTPTPSASVATPAPADSHESGAPPVVAIRGTGAGASWSPTMAYIVGPVGSNRVTLRITADKPTASCADVEKKSSSPSTPQLQMRIFYSEGGGISTNKIIKPSAGRRFDDLYYALQYAPKMGAAVDLKGKVTFTKAPRKPGELAHLTLDISGGGHSWQGETDALVCASESDLKL